MSRILFSGSSSSYLSHSVIFLHDQLRTWLADRNPSATVSASKRLVLEFPPCLSSPVDVIYMCFWCLQVKNRTAVHNTYYFGSHVMQYADLRLNTHQLSLYVGFNPSGDGGVTPVANPLTSSTQTVVNQRDAELVHFWLKVGVSSYQILWRYGFQTLLATN